MSQKFSGQDSLVAINRAADVQWMLKAAAARAENYSALLARFEQLPRPVRIGSQGRALRAKLENGIALNTCVFACRHYDHALLSAPIEAPTFGGGRARWWNREFQQRMAG